MVIFVLLVHQVQLVVKNVQETHSVMLEQQLRAQLGTTHQQLASQVIQNVLLALLVKYVLIFLTESTTVLKATIAQAK